MKYWGWFNSAVSDFVLNEAKFYLYKNSFYRSHLHRFQILGYISQLNIWWIYAVSIFDRLSVINKHILLSSSLILAISAIWNYLWLCIISRWSNVRRNRRSHAVAYIAWREFLNSNTMINMHKLIWKVSWEEPDLNAECKTALATLSQQSQWPYEWTVVNSMTNSLLKCIIYKERFNFDVDFTCIVGFIRMWLQQDWLIDYVVQSSLNTNRLWCFNVVNEYNIISDRNGQINYEIYE